MEQQFASSLGNAERQLLLAVGYGVGLGLPLLFALVFGVPRLLTGHIGAGLTSIAVPVLLAGLLLWARRFRPVGISLTEDAIVINRPVGPMTVAAIRDVVHAARRTNPPNVSRGVRGIASQGFYGSWGSFRSDEHGEFSAWLTDSANVVELQLENGSYAFVTPDAPDEFITAILLAGFQMGKTIDPRTTSSVRVEGLGHVGT